MATRSSIVANTNINISSSTNTTNAGIAQRNRISEISNDDYVLQPSPTHSHSRYESDIFNDDWFGTAHPANENHILDTGRFAFTQVKTEARTFSNVTNPYGLLRSPWNTNPTPYVLRSNYTAYKLFDGYSTLPACSEFSAYVGSALGKSWRNATLAHACLSPKSCAS